VLFEIFGIETEGRERIREKRKEEREESELKRKR